MLPTYLTALWACLLSIVLNVTALPSNTTITSSGTLHTRQNFGTDDITNSGNYQIIYCNADKPQSAAAMLQALLPLIWQQIQKLLLDAKRGTRSKHGFRAFFKTNKSIKVVRRVFQATADGKAVTLSADRAARLGSATATPRFACIKEGDPPTANLLARCNAHPSQVLMTWGRTEIILICPNFWALPSGLMADKCPRVVDNRMVPDDTTMVANMYAAVMHELVHIYHPVTAAEEGEAFREVYDVQKAIDLSAKESLLNANNYALYAAAVQAGCTDFPKTKQEQDLKL